MRQSLLDSGGLGLSRLGMVVLVCIALVYWADAAASENQLKLRASTDNDLCAHFLGQFNRDLSQGSYVRYLQHSEFSAIDWAPGQYEIGGLKYSVKSKISYALFDLNNDGIDDLVFRQTHTLRSRDYDYLYAARVDEFDFSETPTIDVKYLRRLRAIAISPPNPLPLKSRDGKVYASIYLGALFPFIYKGIAYTALESRIYIPGMREKELKILIIEYTGDIPNQRGTMKGHESLNVLCSMIADVRRN